MIQVMDNDDQIFIAIHWYRLYDLQASHVQRATSTMARFTPMRSVPVFFTGTCQILHHGSSSDVTCPRHRQTTASNTRCSAG